ncbi:MAG: phospholipid carrier-dependent glycosyltransferase [bacterium]|nr:phospholipid carrier-dependent glycosyltransferase [bacterium]
MGISGIALAIIAATWLVLWRTGCRWTGACGVTERTDRLALGCILPAAGLLVSVHVTALTCMGREQGWVAPETVAPLYLLLMLALNRLVGRHLPTAAPPRPPSSGRSWRLGWWIIPVSILGGAYGVFLLDALSRYPTGYDGLNYHLPTAVRWMQQHSLNLIPGLFLESLPENGMIVPFLMMFAGLERLLPMVQLPNGIMLAVVSYGLARAAGGSPKAALVCACITMSIPIVVFQCFSSYIDLYAAVSWLAGLLAITWVSRTSDPRQRRHLLILAGLAAGIALGSKCTYLVLVPLLGLVVFAQACPGISGRSRVLAVRGRHCLVFGLASLVCSGFWFVRGTVEAGNPLYPMTFEIGGEKILPGFAIARPYADQRVTRIQRSLGSKLEHWWAYPWHELRYGAGYMFGVGNGLGAAFAAFVPPGLLAGLVWALARRTRAPANLWRTTFALLTGCGVALMLTVFPESLRMVLPLVIISVPAAVALTDRLLTRSPRPVLVTLSIGLAVTAAVATLKPAHALAGRVREGNWTRGGIYETPGNVDRHAPGTRILNLGSAALNYPLAGRTLANRVIGPMEWQTLQAGAPMNAPALRAQSIDYIFVQAPWPDDWPADLPIELVFDNSASRAAPTTPLARLFRVVDSADLAQARTQAQTPARPSADFGPSATSRRTTTPGTS